MTPLIELDEEVRLHCVKNIRTPKATFKTPSTPQNRSSGRFSRSQSPTPDQVHGTSPRAKHVGPRATGKTSRDSSTSLEMTNGCNVTLLAEIEPIHSSFFTGTWSLMQRSVLALSGIASFRSSFGQRIWDVFPLDGYLREAYFYQPFL